METKVEFGESFKTITENCVKNASHLGGGNPNSKILLVGQEAALEEREEWYNKNAEEWQARISNGVDLINFKREEKFKEGHTWNKYQKLHDYIFPEDVIKDYLNFEERIFTTEMSDNPAKKNGEARKKEDFKFHLQSRKDTFFKEGFIQEFPVVVLACSDYIENNDKIREIDTIFNVTYPGDEIGKYGDYSKGNWFFLHYNHNRTRLVIHTRQLSTNVEDKMLKDMGEVIRKHLEGLNNQ